MPLVTGNKRIVKAGSSDVITVTKDISKLGLEVGDNVDVVLSYPSGSSDSLMHILEFYNSEDYIITNGAWINSSGLDDGMSNPDTMKKTDAAEKLFNDVSSTLYDFLMRYTKERGYAFYHDNTLGSFIRTVPRGDSSKLSSFELFSRSFIALDFIKAIFDRFNIQEASLHQLSELYNQLNDVIEVYADIFSSCETGGDFNELLESKNDEWDEFYQQTFGSAGYFVIIATSKPLKNEGGEITFWYPEVGVRYSKFSKSLTMDLDARLRDLADSEGCIDFDPKNWYRVFGPMDERQATQFANYLDMWVRLNVGNHDERQILDWSENQFEEYMDSIRLIGPKEEVGFN